MRLIAKIETRVGKNTVVITGAASGIGMAFCQLFVEAGWTVCAIDTNAEALQALYDNAPASKKLSTVTCDVTDYANLATCIRKFHDMCGGIGLLINAAGVGASGLLEELELADWQQVIDTNLMGVVNATHILLPYMKTQGFGHICSIASAAAYHSLPTLSAYNMSKAAVVSMTETLQAELDDSPVSASVMISAFYKSNIANFTLGGDNARILAAGLVEISKMTAEEAATQTLNGIAKGDTHIVVGSQANILYRFKRFFPKTYAALAPRIARKAFAKAAQTMPPQLPPQG